MAKTTASKISSAASGPAPKAIGKGPMKITTPELAESPPNTAATAMKRPPKKTKKKPAAKTQLKRLDTDYSCSLSSSTSSVFSVIAFSPKQKIVNQHNND
jgi:hypothetical protein